MCVKRENIKSQILVFIRNNLSWFRRVPSVILAIFHHSLFVASRLNCSKVKCSKSLFEFTFFKFWQTVLNYFTEKRQLIKSGKLGS